MTTGTDTQQAYTNAYTSDQAVRNPAQARARRGPTPGVCDKITGLGLASAGPAQKRVHFLGAAVSGTRAEDAISIRGLSPICLRRGRLPAVGGRAYAGL
jgi:hypothetical protein